MIYLSKQEILNFNYQLYKKYGGAFHPPYNLLNESSLDYLIGIAQDDSYFPSIFDKASIYFVNISTRHVFNDGNKRTATFSAIAFLENNFFELCPSVTSKDLTTFAIKIANNSLNQQDCSQWLSENCQEIIPETIISNEYDNDMASPSDEEE